MLGYRVPAPDQAMLISGGKQKAEAGGQFRIVTGHGAWAMPFFRKVRFLSLEEHQVDFAEKCYTNHGIGINVSAVVAFKVDNNPSAITAAAQRFLNDQQQGQMEGLTKKIFVGHLRGICGRMTVEEIIQNREKLTEEVLMGSQNEMSAMGLHVDSLQIETFDDVDGNYIQDMAKPQRAAIKQAAEIAQAQADQLSQAARQESLRRQAEQERNTATAQAQYKAEVDKAQAEAEAAGQLAHADVERQVLERQQAVADTNAELVQRQLVAEQIRPAEAAARALRIQADAQASAAEGQKAQAQHVADAQAYTQRKQAEVQAYQLTQQAQAQKDAALLNAEAIKAEGLAEAAAKEAEGLAEAKAIEAKGLAEAAGEKAKAEALAADGAVQLERLRIEAMPAALRELGNAMGLQHANINLTNGAEGLAQVFAVIAPTLKSLTDVAADYVAGKVTTVQIPDSPASLNGTAADREEGLV